MDSTREDVLILGSSRAEHHFVPNIINEGENYSVYNCGVGGEDLLFSGIQLKESLKRYKPKLVVVEVSPSSLFMPDTEQKIKILLPYYQRDSAIFNALTHNKIAEKIKFASSIYPYNSTIASLMLGVFKNNVDTFRGFSPKYGTIDTTGLLKTVYRGMPNAFPQEKFTHMRHLLNTCQENDIKVVVVNSPVYVTTSNYDAISQQIKNISSEYSNTHYIDYSKHDSVYNKVAFFKDNTHLNYKGAVIFSKALSNELKGIFHQTLSKN